jgi:NhaP-type Na+/H+ or K+/H+ antiporter
VRQLPLSALLYKQLEVHRHGDASLEAALSFTFPWASYFLAEAKGLSGVVVSVAASLGYSPARVAGLARGSTISRLGMAVHASAR